MSKYPETVQTKNKKGDIEVRNLVSQGAFVMYDYRDPETFKQVESSKKKIYLKDENGQVSEYYIIPLKTGNRSLLVKPDKPEEKVRKVWDDRTKKEEDLWKT
jgi:Zn-dependent M16 (insulinase) family peptidase